MLIPGTEGMRYVGNAAVSKTTYMQTGLPQSMIVVQNRIHVREEYRVKFEKLFSEGESTLSEVPGFVSNEVLRPLNGSEYVVMTHWQTIEDFQNWRKSDSFRKAHSGERLPDEAFDGDSQVTIHEVFLTR